MKPINKRNYVLKNLTSFEKKYYKNRLKLTVILPFITFAWYLVDTIRLGSRQAVYDHSYAWVMAIICVVVWAIEAVLFKWMQQRENEILIKGGFKL